MEVGAMEVGKVWTKLRYSEDRNESNLSKSKGLKVKEEYRLSLKAARWTDGREEINIYPLLELFTDLLKKCF